MLRACLALLTGMFFATAGFAGAAPGPNPLANLFGVVYSEASNERVVHASVWLCDDGGNRLREAITNDQGEFGFAALHVGAYMLKVSMSGYLPLEMNVNVDFSSSAGVSVFLRPASKTHPETPGGSSVSAHELSMPADARRLADSGKKKLYGETKPDAALRDLQQAAAKAPDYYEAYYHMGMAYLALKDPARAEENLKKAVELSNESYADADLALAFLYLGRRDATQGEPLLRRGLELNPNSWIGCYELGKLELYRMHLAPALDAANRAQSLAPNEPKVYHLLSLIHLREKNYPAAISDLDAYIRLDPNSPDGKTAEQIRDDLRHRVSN
jgi:tetratricopeptide (TPR) repeat protein